MKKMQTFHDLSEIAKINEMKKSIRRIAKMGYAAKGVVYSLAGGLTVAAALSLGRQTAGKTGAIKFLEDQVLGQILLVLLSVGLFCYAFWRFYQSLRDPEHVGSDKRGKAKLFAYFISGLIYIGLAVFTMMQAWSGTNSGSGDGMFQSLSGSTRNYVFAIVAIGLVIKGGHQFLQAARGTFISKYHLDDIRNIKTRRLVRNIGYAGLYARGVVLLILAYIFFRATTWIGAGGEEQVGGMSQAFSFLREAGGPWLVGLIALGLLCYGLYMLILSRYRQF